MRSLSLGVREVALRGIHSSSNRKACSLLPPPNPPRRYSDYKNRHHLPELNLRRQATVAGMADDAKKNQQQQDPLMGKKEEDKAKEVVEVPPPPPEKPEPGDCCGSGCVRCVWDIYYEELEDYENRYGKAPQSKSN